MTSWLDFEKNLRFIGTLAVTQQLGVEETKEY